MAQDTPDTNLEATNKAPESSGVDSPLLREAYVFGGALWDSTKKAAHDPMSLVKMAGGAALGFGLTVAQARFRPLEAVISTLGLEAAITALPTGIRKGKEMADIASRTWGSDASLDTDRKKASEVTDSVVDFGLMGAPSMVAPAVRSAMLRPLWQRAEEIPFFLKPDLPPSVAMSNAFDQTAPGVGRLGVIIPGAEGKIGVTHGTVFALADDPRLLLTSLHTLDGASNVSAFFGGKEHAVEFLGLSAKKEMVLLRLAEEHPDVPITGLKLAEGTPLKGDSLMAMGFQSADKANSSYAFKASLGSYIKENQYGADVLAMKAPGGFSGAPVVNEAGEVQDMVIGHKMTWLDKKLNRYDRSRIKGGNGETYAVGSHEILDFVEANRNNTPIPLPKMDWSKLTFI